MHWPVCLLLHVKQPLAYQNTPISISNNDIIHFKGKPRQTYFNFTKDVLLPFSSAISLLPISLDKYTIVLESDGSDCLMGELGFEVYRTLYKDDCR